MRLFSNLNLQDLQILSPRIEQLSSDPATPQLSQIWFNTTTGFLKVRNATRSVVVDDQYVTQVKPSALISVSGGLTPIVSLLGSAVSGQPLLSQGTGADPVYGPLNLAGGNSVVVGVLPSANGGLGSSIPATARANIGAAGKATGLIGDGTSSTLSFAHNLNLANKNAFTVMVCIEATGEVIYPDILVVDVNTIQIIYDSSVKPAANAHRVTVIG